MIQPLLADIPATVTAIASVIAALGSIFAAGSVLYAARQLKLTEQQAVTSFEDDFDREYRKLTKQIPTKAFLNEKLSHDDLMAAEKAFYRYLDLSNGQAFLRQNNRISKQTWKFWCDGIESNMNRPAFKQAWDHISVKAEKDFNELRLLMAREYKVDPVDWPKI